MNWNNFTRVVAPATTVVTLDEAKAHLRISHDDDDDYIEALIDAATAYIDGPYGAGIALLTQTWRLSLDRFPNGALRLPLCPVQAVTAITYTDLAGTVQTLSAGSYSVDTDRSPAILFPTYGTSFPTPQAIPGAVKITMRVGYEPADLPADLRRAVLLLIGHLNENREPIVGITGSVTPIELPFTINAILNRYRPTPVA